MLRMSLLLLFAFFVGVSANENIGFVVSSKSEYQNVDAYLRRLENIHKIKINMDAPGLYIFVENENLEESFYHVNADFAFVFLSEGENAARVFYVPQVPESAGPGVDKWRNCIFEINKRHQDQIQKKCIVTKTFSADILNRSKKIFATGMMSVEGRYGLRRFGYLHIVSVDSVGTKAFFHMPSSNNFKLGKSVFFKDYISLYDSLKEIMVDGFSDCRWNDFNNVDEIIKECENYEGGVFFNEGLR